MFNSRAIGAIELSNESSAWGTIASVWHAVSRVFKDSTFSATYTHMHGLYS